MSGRRFISALLFVVFAFVGGASLVAQWQTGSWRLPFEIAALEEAEATADMPDAKDEEDARASLEIDDEISRVESSQYRENGVSGRGISEAFDPILLEDASRQSEERLSSLQRDHDSGLDQSQSYETAQLLPRFSTIEIAPDGTTVVLGVSAPGAVVRVFLDGRETGSALVDTDGRWATTLARTLAPGAYKLKAIGVDGAGVVAHGRVVEFSVPAASDDAYRIALDQEEALEPVKTASKPSPGSLRPMETSRDRSERPATGLLDRADELANAASEKFSEWLNRNTRQPGRNDTVDDEGVQQTAELDPALTERLAERDNGLATKSRDVGDSDGIFDRAEGLAQTAKGRVADLWRRLNDKDEEVDDRVVERLPAGDRAMAEADSGLSSSSADDRAAAPEVLADNDRIGRPPSMRDERESAGIVGRLGSDRVAELLSREFSRPSVPGSENLPQPKRETTIVRLPEDPTQGPRPAEDARDSRTWQTNVVRRRSRPVVETLEPEPSKDRLGETGIWVADDSRRSGDPATSTTSKLAANWQDELVTASRIELPIRRPDTSDRYADLVLPVRQPRHKFKPRVTALAGRVGSLGALSSEKATLRRVRRGQRVAAYSRRAKSTSKNRRKVSRRKSRWHRVRRDETLWDIARKYYGDGRLYRRLYRKNRRRIASPHRIYPNQRIRLR